MLNEVWIRVFTCSVAGENILRNITAWILWVMKCGIWKLHRLWSFEGTADQEPVGLRNKPEAVQIILY